MTLKANRAPKPNSVEAFCAEEGVCRATAYAEIRIGRLPARKLNGRTLIFPTDRIVWRDRLPYMSPRANSNDRT